MLGVLWNQFLGVIRTITPIDLLDVAVVAFFIYQAIKWVRDTRAVQLVKGLVALLLIYVITTQLGLKTMGFIMQNVLQFGVLALLVVFQPELRKILEQVGRTKLTNLSVFTYGSADETEEIARFRKTISSVCEAAASLSRQKIGALIVFERETKLGEIIKTGTVIDSDPSMDLIGTIFFPNCPLHDGAVIIRNARLFAAGCFLPLSDNFEISKTLGTRHRAALGMSENSDAVVVVVSEETGVITVAMGGKLRRGLSVEELGQVLRSEILHEMEDKPPEKKTLFKKVKRQ